ncbi:MAG TPA: YcxB family protein [Terracidiphilus sp.]|nr:YcxB family protein [Terracidiphilus sp.]
MISIQFEFTVQDYLNAQKLHLKQSLIQWLAYWGFIRVAAPILGAIGVVFGCMMLRGGFDPWISATWGASLVLLFLPLLYRWNLKRCYRKTRFNDGQCSFAFDENLIRTQTSNSRGEVEWPAIRFFSEDNNLFLLYVAQAKFFPIPKRACNEEQVNELRALFQARIRPASS